MNELSDYKISDGYPDVRGWDVKDFDNRIVGKVDNLLVNKDAERVVYLDVEVDKTIIDAKHDPYGRPNHMEVREFVNKDGENHIIIPIGLVDLNSDSNYVYTDILDHQTFSETKRYRKGDNVDRQYEVQVLDSYGRKNRRRDDDNDIFDDNNIMDETINRENNVTYDDIPSESRIRAIVREEIKAYHDKNDDSDAERRRYSDNDNRRRYSEDVDDAVILTDEERESNRRRRNADVDDAVIFTDEERESNRRRRNDDMDDNVIFTDEERELDRRRRNDDLNDDDRFYERREFDDKRFRNRTPGL